MICISARFRIVVPSRPCRFWFLLSRSRSRCCCRFRRWCTCCRWHRCIRRLRRWCACCRRLRRTCRPWCWRARCCWHRRICRHRRWRTCCCRHRCRRLSWKQGRWRLGRFRWGRWGKSRRRRRGFGWARSRHSYNLYRHRRCTGEKYSRQCTYTNSYYHSKQQCRTKNYFFTHKFIPLF